MSTPLPDVLAKLRQQGPLRDAIETLRRFTDYSEFTGDDPPPHAEAAKMVLQFLGDVEEADAPRILTRTEKVEAIAALGRHVGTLRGAKKEMKAGTGYFDLQARYEAANRAWDKIAATRPADEK